MLKKIEKQIDENSPYTFIGKDGNHNVYLVPVRENKENVAKKRTQEEWEKLEKELLNDNMEFPEEYYNDNWDDTPAAAEDEKIINRYDFYNMDYKDQQYHLYRQLVNISSLLSDIKEVLTDGTKIG